MLGLHQKETKDTSLQNIIIYVLYLVATVYMYLATGLARALLGS